MEKSFHVILMFGTFNLFLNENDIKWPWISSFLDGSMVIKNLHRRSTEYTRPGQRLQKANLKPWPSRNSGWNPSYEMVDLSSSFFVNVYQRVIHEISRYSHEIPRYFLAKSTISQKVIERSQWLFHDCVSLRVSRNGYKVRALWPYGHVWRLHPWKLTPTVNQVTCVNLSRFRKAGGLTL